MIVANLCLATVKRTPRSCPATTLSPAGETLLGAPTSGNGPREGPRYSWMVSITVHRLRWISTNSMKIPPKTKHRIPVWSKNSTSGYIPWKTESRGLKRYVYTRVHGIIYSNQAIEATQESIMDDSISKMWSVHAMRYHSAVKRKGILGITCWSSG